MTDEPTPLRLTDLFHHRWALPILLRIVATDGCRFSELVHGLGVSRDTLSTTLKALVAHGFATRAQGDGHPLRPEYLPTDRGRRIAIAGVPLLAELEAYNLTEVALKKYSLPTLHAVEGGAHRFGGLREALQPVTPRALSFALGELIATRLLTHYPADAPRALYVLGPLAKPILPHLGTIAAALR